MVKCLDLMVKCLDTVKLTVCIGAFPCKLSFVITRQMNEDPHRKVARPLWLQWLPLRDAIGFQTYLGYAALINKYEIMCMPHWHVSVREEDCDRRYSVSRVYPRPGISMLESGVTLEVFDYDKAETNDLSNMLHGLAHDGISLEVMNYMFGKAEFVDSLRSLYRHYSCTPNIRRLCFFCEFLYPGRTGDFPECPRACQQVHALVPPYIGVGGQIVDINDKFLVINNLPGTRELCPLWRQTARDGRDVERQLSDRLTSLIHDYQTSSDVLERAHTYLSVKETKSSFRIEGLTPAEGTTQRHAQALRDCGHHPLSRDTLLTVVNRMLDGSVDSYRSKWVYVGQSTPLGVERMHYLAPSPSVIDEMMTGFFQLYDNLMSDNDMSVIECAAVLAFCFVYIHPFDDGNGRLHRYIISHLLSRKNFTPVVLPVSAIILEDSNGYNQCLEAVSVPLGKYGQLPGLKNAPYDGFKLVFESNLDDGLIELAGADNNTDYYRYFDMTKHVEYPRKWVVDCVNRVCNETIFLSGFDSARATLKATYDMTDKLIDSVLKFLMANHDGKFSMNMRKKLPAISDAMAHDIEDIIAEIKMKIK